MPATEPRSSPAPSRGRISRPSTRGTRSTRLQVEIGPGSQGKVSDEGGDSAEDTGANDEDDEEGEEGEEGISDENEGEGEKGGSRSTRAQTSRSKAKDNRPSTGTATRRTARRR